MKSASSLIQTAHNSVPLFLAPAFADFSIPTSTTSRFFSSCHRLQLRKGRRDLSKRRGESVIRSTGPRTTLNVQRLYKELPKPETETQRASRLKEFKTNPNHGLYGFFNEDKQTVIPGEKEEQHGRGWAIRELTWKSFEELHALYWKSLVEMNRVKTRGLEHQRLKLGYGAVEIEARQKEIRKTLTNIRFVLRMRQDAWAEAKVIKEKTRTMEELRQWLEEEETKLGRNSSWEYQYATTSSVPDLESTVKSDIPEQTSPVPSATPTDTSSQPRARS